MRKMAGQSILHIVCVCINRIGTVDSFDYGDRYVVEEHIFVPRTAAMAETDGWLIGTALDVRDRVTRVSVFDAARLNDGPLATIALPYVLPPGFHGTFVGA